jgi:transposase-like protein
MSNPFGYFNSSPGVIRLVVMMYVRYPLSLRNVEDLLAERGIDISHETIRFWWPDVRGRDQEEARVAHMRGFTQWRRHLDEVFVKINGQLCYLRRAVDHEGEVLETVVTAKRDKAAALKFLKRIMKKHGRPRSSSLTGSPRILLPCERSAAQTARRLGADATIARRIRISRFDDENEPYSGFEAQRHYRNSAPFMLRSIIISTWNVISSPAKSTNRGAWPR